MSYGTYSEVYLAINNENKHYFKIGETINARWRGKQLRTYAITNYFELEKFYHYKYGEFANNKTMRLFIESYLRARILKAYPGVTLQGNDYFISEANELLIIFQKNFNVWCQTLQKLFQKFNIKG